MDVFSSWVNGHPASLRWSMGAAQGLVSTGPHRSLVRIKLVPSDRDVEVTSSYRKEKFISKPQAHAHGFLQRCGALG